MDWFFNGLGTFLIGILIGTPSGILIGRITVKRNIKQTQKAKNNAMQIQIGA